MRHDPRYYYANRRVSCASGFICGTPNIPPPMKKVVHDPRMGRSATGKRTPAQCQTIREATIAAWARRKK